MQSHRGPLTSRIILATLRQLRGHRFHLSAAVALCGILVFVIMMHIQCTYCKRAAEDQSPRLGSQGTD